MSASHLGERNHSNVFGKIDTTLVPGQSAFHEKDSVLEVRKHVHCPAPCRHSRGGGVEK